MVDVRIRCFDGEWVDVGGARLLLYKLKYEGGSAPAPSTGLEGLVAAVGGSGDLSEAIGALRDSLGLSRLKLDCDLVLVELSYAGIRFSYAVSRKMVRCVPLSPAPDQVKSIEVLSKSPDATSVEVDALQRSLLSRSKRQLESELYASCLVGEVSSPDTVAIGIELLNYGMRTVMAGELKETLVKERPARAKRRRSRRRKKGKKRLKK